MPSMETLDSQALGTAIANQLKGTVAENARILGTSRQHLNNIIKGRKIPSTELLLRIQQHFKISTQKILTKKAV